jgi:hypothetical protein
LYAQLRDSKNTNDALQQLRTIMRGFREPIIGKEKAQDFLKKIHDFNDNYSKKSKSKSDRSTINSTPYYEKDEDDEYGYTDKKNLPPQNLPIVNPVAAI